MGAVCGALSGPVREGPGHGQEQVVGLGLADGAPGTLAGDGPDADPGCGAGRREASCTRLRSLTVVSTRSSSSASAASDATAAAWARLLTVKVSMVLRTAWATAGCPTMNPTRSPASP